MRVSAGAFGWDSACCVGAQAQPRTEPVEPAEPGPDIELLEYLGGLVRRARSWVGPDDMQGVSNERDAPIVLDDDAASRATIE